MTPQAKRRRHHLRSRGGCEGCKARHVRCDESRPSCIKCLAGKRECHYKSPIITAKDIRILTVPGVLIWEASGNRASDPFESLPIRMELRSHELLHYFKQANSDLGSVRRPWQLSSLVQNFTVNPPSLDCIALNSNDRYMFRSMLLVAALHFAWKTGSIAIFEKTFLYHKGESIRLVNEMLDDTLSRTSRGCMILIAAMSFVETTLGNLDASDIHIQGLLTLFKLSPRLLDGEEGLFERLLVTTYMYSSAVKSRLSISSGSQTSMPEPWQTSFTTLWDNLCALRMLPYYFVTTPSGRYPEVDIVPILIAIRELTVAAAKAQQTHKRTHYVRDPEMAGSFNICDSDQPENCMGCMTMSAAFHAHSRIQADSLSHSYSKVRVELSSAWCGWVIPESFYLRTCLGLWDDGQPIDSQLFAFLMATFKKDIETMDEDRWRFKLRNRLWFWKVFVMAYTVRVMTVTCYQKTRDTLAYHTGLNLQNSPPPSWFRAKIRQWAKYVSVKEWPQARAALYEIVWIDLGSRESLAEAVWNEAQRAEEEVD